MYQTLKSACCLFAVSILLAACGNKGSLTLPPKPGTAQEKAAAKPAAAADHNSAQTPARQ